MAVLESSKFQRAFAAMSYLVGRRDAELLDAIRVPNDDARALLRSLAHPARERRAEILARELAQMVSALEARTLK
jgi:hypothetical protein